MLEVYHNLQTKYCPKRVHFQLTGMIARTQLAILNHNNNLNRDRATTKSGNLQFKYIHSKVSQNWAAKPILEKKVTSYMDDMIKEVCLTEKENIPLASPVTPYIPITIAPTPRPSIESLLSRRNRFTEAP